jgi:glucosylceramidase
MMMVMKNAWLSLIGLSFAVIVAGCAKGGAGGGGTGGNAGPCGTASQAQCKGVCIDVSSDSQNCGTCDLTCDQGQACQRGVCVCATGFVSCSGMCVPSNTDHCGSTCVACSSGQVCSGGACSSAGCGSGSTMCSDGACSANNDTGHCGSSCTVCPAGASCTNGTCGCTVANQQDCNGTCVDTSSSTGNCGSCGNACPFGDSCTNGACVGASTGGTSGGGGSSSTGGTTGSGGSGSGTGGATGGGGSGSGTGGSTGTGGSQSNQPVLVTSAANAFWKTTGTLSLASGNPTPTVTVTSNAKQNWEGFGGAFNEMGWNYIQMLSASDQAKAIDLLFGSDAAHFSNGRIPIGASDYALQRYTDDEVSSGTDANLASFSITEDMKYLIPYVNAAKQVNPDLKFWASPWTPPTWMKTFTGSNSNGTSCAKAGNTNYDGGCMNATSANLSTLAQYFVKWVAAYSQQGIPITTLAPQNEPNYAQGYPSCLWNTADYVSFLKGPLAQAFPSSGSTKIMLGTMSNGDNGTSSFDLKVVQGVEADGTAKTLPVVMGLQWGMLDLYEGLSSGIGPSNFNTGSLQVWATEHKCGNYPWNPGGNNPATGVAFPKYVEPAPNDQAYGFESWCYIRNAINKAGVTSYNAWNMVLDTVGKGNDTTRQWSQDALLVVNTSTKVLTLTPAYYVFRHCAQYVQVGAQVLGTTGGDAIAWKNPDGSTVVTMYNSGGATTYTVSIAGKLVQFAMPASGWATIMMPAGA